MTKAAELAKMGEVLTNSQLGERKNMVINGGMEICQRSTSVTGLGGSEVYFVQDRYKIGLGDATAGRFTATKETSDVPDGFKSAMKLACTTADTSIAAGEFFAINQHIEADICVRTAAGTSSAKEVTLSFYAKANANATYVVQLLNNKHSGYIHNNRTFSVTTSWQRFTMTFQADTTADSKFDGDLTAGGFSLAFILHAGSNYTSATLASDWATGVTNRAAGADSFFDSTSNTFFLTGVQLELGNQATSFEHLSTGESLNMCQRYYYRRTISSAGFNNEYFSAVYAYGTTDVQGGQLHPVQMRATPAVTFDGILKITNGSAAASHTGASSFSFTSYSSVDNLSLYTHSGCFSGLTQHRSYMMYGDTNDFIEVSSEL